MAIHTARTFFARLAERDLEGVRMLLDPSFVMTVSGNYRFTDIAEFVAFSGERNGAIRKSPEAYETCRTDEGIAVYCIGTMSGSWLDGSHFEGIRFIDRFLVGGQKILDLQVWSDMSEFRPTSGAE
jgi:hypothetical protein